MKKMITLLKRRFKKDAYDNTPWKSPTEYHQLARKYGIFDPERLRKELKKREIPEPTK